MSSIEKLFNLLEGKWRLSRIIASQGSVSGSASFVRNQKNPQSLLYTEDGVFTTNDKKTMNVYRNYIYTLEKDSIAVYFDETPPRHFHTLLFSQLPDALYPCTALVSHKCPPDTYIGFFNFSSVGEFSLFYDVTGPQKNFSIQTTFTKENQ